MIHVAAIRMQQFGVSFYQASLTARDVSRLVRFEVLSYGEQRHPPVRGRKGQGPIRSKVNWDLLERRIAGSDRAYQRQIIDGKTYTRTRAGRYLDHFRKRNGEWRVSRRQVIDDWSRLDQVVSAAREVGPDNHHGTRNLRDPSYVVDWFGKG